MADVYNFFGLCVNIIGALLILSGVYVTKAQAVNVGVTRLASGKADENLRLPSVVDRLRESKRAVWGTICLLVGFVLQAIGTWPF